MPPPSRSRPLVLALVALIAISLMAPPTFSASPAVAAPVTDFDPGNIIADSVMYDSSTMGTAAIQTFLNTRGASCSPTTGNTCIKGYRESTPTRPADALCPGGYPGASNESAATIIAKVSTACGINPQVLLVTLQKEQGLITATAGKSAATYSRALGFGCPDNVGGWCDPSYAGFANQVYSGAKQLKRYAANPTGYSYRAGRTNTILWHPNTACGSSQVYIQNQATASLYNYTPYRPNAAALAAGYGTGDACSSYGNRNFHLYFTAWFGSAKQRAPIGVVDEVSTAPGGGAIRVRGWAMDPDTSASITIHVYVDGTPVRAVSADGARPDIDRTYRNGAAHGFDTIVPAAQGSRSVCVYAIDSTGGHNPRIGCVNVTVASAVPIGNLDTVSGRSGEIHVGGWAMDPDTSDPINVHVYLDGRAVRALRADGTRSDIERIFKNGAQHGFNGTIAAPDGTSEVCIYAIDPSGGANPRIGCASVDVHNSPPRGSLDVVRATGPGTVQVRGWAFDPDTDKSIAVHVHVDGRPWAATAANTYRPDVARAHGIGDAHGFDTSIRIPRGAHEVCVYAIDATLGQNPRLGCRSVDVPNSAPQGALESAVGLVGTATPGSTLPGRLRLTGWAWDFDSTTHVAVRVTVDGVAVKDGNADRLRTDLGSQGVTATYVGFDLTVPATPGEHSVCLHANDPDTADWVAIGCSEVALPNATPVGAVDVAGAVAGGVRLRGWAMDPDTTAPVLVHVYIDGLLAGALRADVSRPDVDRVYGNGAQRGFDTIFPTDVGPHTVCIYAINQPTGPNPVLGCYAVTVA